MPQKPRRRKGGEDDLFDGLPLAPPGRPELICRWCGGPKIPAQRCLTCNSNPKNPPNEIARIKIENWRKQKLREYRNRFRKRGNANARSLRRRVIRRTRFQITELDRLIIMLFNCFERDRGGDWQLYADRLEELQAALNEVEILLPQIRKLRSYFIEPI